MTPSELKKIKELLYTDIGSANRVINELVDEVEKWHKEYKLLMEEFSEYKNPNMWSDHFKSVRDKL
ncbi:hypothetical protein KAR91_25945 [Candidatus Pacearchaeota archaeon]|nr:hypothetical protein [Candidatus Pacearchaeota archaeon]